MVDDKITLEINADELLRELEAIEIKANEIETIVEKAEDKAEISFTNVLSMVHAGWLTTQGLVRAAGGTIQTVFRTVIGTALGTAAVLYPLFTAMEVTPGMQIQATLGLISMGISLAALVAAQQEEKEFSDALRGANMALHGVQSMLGSMYFLS